MSKVSVIIPCYNEAASITAVLKKISSAVAEIIVVDNNSTDQTAVLAKQEGARVIQETKQGYGAAIRAGFRVAQGDILVVLDGDGQYPANLIMDLVNHLETKKLDFISASRFPLVDKKSLPFSRRFGNQLFNLAVTFIFGVNIKDSQSGMWVFRRSVLEKIALESDSMPLSEEIKLKVINEPNLCFSEYPINYHPRRAPSKLLPLRHGWLNLLYLLKLKKEFIKIDRRPLWFLGAVISLSLVFILLASLHISEPFYHVTGDVNGENGIAAWNIVNNGATNMKFGLYTQAFTDNPLTGQFYTHHPAGFIWPTVWSYQLFGVNELTTRLGPLLFMLLGFWFWAYGLRKIFFPKIVSPLIILAIFSILPGVVFYGETLELAIFSLPAALISWSLFIAWQKRSNQFYLIAFYLSVLIGSLVGWFYQLMIFSIWLVLLLSPQIKKHWSVLIITPLVSALGVALNLLHFYWLNGNVWTNLLISLRYRMERPEIMQFWWHRIYYLMELHFTDLFLYLALAGLIIFIAQYFYRRSEQHRYFLPWFIFPFLVFIILTQWSTHPFGVIFLAPLVALLAAWFINVLINFLKSRLDEQFTGFLVVIIIFSLGLGLSISKLDFFFKDYQILQEADLQLVKSLVPKVQNNELCLGRNDLGVGFKGIVQWNLQKNVSHSPQCLETARLAIIFNPSFGDFYRAEADLFLQSAWRPLYCSGNFCLLEK